MSYTIPLLTYTCTYFLSGLRVHPAKDQLRFLLYYNLTKQLWALLTISNIMETVECEERYN